MEYSHNSIEKKWQKYWYKNKTFKTNTNNKQKFYVLDMFPYPSGKGLHVGHPKGYTATDVFARYKRMQGYNVLHPIGWDAFGLPAEQYAIQTKNDPKEFTNKNIQNFKEQLLSLGFMFDFDKEINTTDPNYFKTTQYIFTLLYKHGLAEIVYAKVNWCEELKTVLSNEELVYIDNKPYSERGHFLVTKKTMKQWVLKITKYSEKLIKGLEELDWPKSVKNLQKNWIGLEKGYEVKFGNNFEDNKIKVFIKDLNIMNNPYFVSIPMESKIIDKIQNPIIKKQVKEFINENIHQNELDRQNIKLIKKAIKTDLHLINPINNKIIPIYITNYTLSNYGKNIEFANPNNNILDKKYFKNHNIHFEKEILNKNLYSILESKKIINKKNKYKMRDWLFSRQRYWGEPIPIVHLENGELHCHSKEELPILLPDIKEIDFHSNKANPLSDAENWKNIKIFNQKGTRELNTMPQWAGSCWYYIAYILKKEDNTYLDIDSKEAKELLNYWLPVDLYIGGQEHAVLHLLYARFWHLFLNDIGILDTKEPFIKLLNQGMILGPDGQKMSKSKGNTINPNGIVKSHGADALRLYEMFMGPLESSLPWSYKGLDSSRKWLDRIFRFFKKYGISDLGKEKSNKAHAFLIKNATNYLNQYNFNKVISEMMIFINKIYKNKQPLYKKHFLDFIAILSLFAPHLSQEIYSTINNNNEQIINYSWPKYDQNLCLDVKTFLIVQINGKFKGKISNCDTQEEAIDEISKNLNLYKYIKDKKYNIIFVKNKIINIIIQ